MVGPPARRELERQGWRTRLEFVEQRSRSRDGKLLAARPQWTAEVQRFETELIQARVTAETPERAWRDLLLQVRQGKVDHHRRVRFA